MYSPRCVQADMSYKTLDMSFRQNLPARLHMKTCTKTARVSFFRQLTPHSASHPPLKHSSAHLLNSLPSNRFPKLCLATSYISQTPLFPHSAGQPVLQGPFTPTLGVKFAWTETHQPMTCAHTLPPHMRHHPYHKPLHACPHIRTHSIRVSTADTRQDPLPQSRAGRYRPQPSSCPPSGLQPASTSTT